MLGGGGRVLSHAPGMVFSFLQSYYIFKIYFFSNVVIFMAKTGGPLFLINKFCWPSTFKNPTSKSKIQHNPGTLVGYSFERKKYTSEKTVF
jgi:hypothetical protein